MPTTSLPGPRSVLIAGGGVAALEALIALRDLAGDHVALTLLAPEEAFVYRPLSTARPFSLGHPTRHPLEALAADFRADFVHGSITEVVPDSHTVRLTTGDTLGYSALLVAVGARSRPIPHAITFGEDPTDAALHGLLTDLEAGYVEHIAFVVPAGDGWTLPLYELALLTAGAAENAGIRARFTVVTPEPTPLALFGATASHEVARLLTDAGIEFIGSVDAEVGHNRVTLGTAQTALMPVRTVALPRLTGPALAGLPSDADGFILTDPLGRVAGVKDVFAAGDSTAFPVKQGGLAAQQADVAAESIAAWAGAPVTPAPFRPVLRGLLLLTHGKRYLRRDLAGETAGEVDELALWWPPTKVAGRYLAPYLFEHEEHELLGVPDEPHVAVDLPLEPPAAHATGEPGIELLGAGSPRGRGRA